MPPIIKVADQNQLVETVRYPYAKWKFDKLNPVQSRVFEFYDKKINGLIAASTSSGKTICGELFLAHEIRTSGGKGIYLGPIKALAQERLDDWSDKSHHFCDLKVSVCTSDYRLTKKRQRELDEANLVIMTYEMFAHRVRHFKSEQSNFVRSAGVLIIDEGHSVTYPNRGHHLEAGLMKFTEINPASRIIMLSATMPNVNEIAEWVSYALTKRETFVLNSDYRPCPLNVHYEKYEEGKSYDENESQKVDLAMQIVEYYPDDKFLIFAHTKRTGELMKQALIAAGIATDFHNADADKEKRIGLINKFKDDKNFRVLVATSTMAQGINCPARRVVVLGVHRGMEEVATYDILQEIGRSGRPGFDPVGDAYILLPEKQFDLQKARLKTPTPIKSQMLEESPGGYKNLAFHLVSEIHQGNIVTKDDVHRWYERSLARFQSHDLDDVIVDKTMDLLRKCGAVWEEDGKYTVTSVGKVASLFYFSPFDVADLKKNFTLLFDNNKEEDDYWLSCALGNLDTHRFGIVSRAEREEMSRYTSQIEMIHGKGTIWEPAIKAGFCYYLLLNGRSNNRLAGVARGLSLDFPRVNQVLQALDSLSGKWGKKGWFDYLQLRMNYGVKGPMVVLCQIGNVGKVRATKLWQNNIRSLQDFVDNPVKVKNVLGLKQEKIDAMINEAKTQLLA